MAGVEGTEEEMLSPRSLILIDDDDGGAGGDDVADGVAAAGVAALALALAFAAASFAARRWSIFSFRRAMTSSCDSFGPFQRWLLLLAAASLPARRIPLSRLRTEARSDERDRRSAADFW